jgi:hypothetical protein
MLSMATVFGRSACGGGTSLRAYRRVLKSVLIRVDLPRPDSPAERGVSRRRYSDFAAERFAVGFAARICTRSECCNASPLHRALACFVRLQRTIRLLAARERREHGPESEQCSAQRAVEQLG